MSTVTGAYDIAVLVSGDKDFMPALEKTRMLGKKVAICSMRNSCNRDLKSVEANIRDFDMIWLDDHLDDLIVPKELVSPGVSPVDNQLISIMLTVSALSELL